jgi:murein DD-endopeptidase MepM/ murein hydrolase activator NlpD
VDDRLTSNGIYAVLPDSNHKYETGPTEPRHWPIDSLRFSAVVTRGQFESGPEAHRGIDIAVSEGTPIRAAGGGMVAGAAFDPEYGLFVLIEHPGGYQTMYGHASRLLVEAGQHIEPGEIIALAGSTGRSTAPHLHFELRREGQLIDPFNLINPES